MLNYKKVLALIEMYIRTVKDVWLKDGPIPFFEEQLRIAKLSYDIYTVPDQEETTC